MTMKNKILIAYSSNFRNLNTFRQKTLKLIENIENYSITAINDTNNLINSVFSKEVETEAITKNNQTFRDIKKIMRGHQYAIFFWDGTELEQYIYIANLLKIKCRTVTVETTKIINKDKGEEYDIYIGRGTPWGNPYAIGDNGMTREDVIEKYKLYFKETYINNPSKLKELKSLKNKRLGCHCKPAACHGDVIAEFLNSLDD